MIPLLAVHVQVCRENRKSWGAPAGSQRRVNSYTLPAGRQPATRLPAFTGKYRVGRVLSFFSSPRNLGLPQPLTCRRVCPPPPVLGRGTHSLAREGLGESQFRRGNIQYTVVLFIYMYFVIVPRRLFIPALQ
jgi:hypothetical protein